MAGGRAGARAKRLQSAAEAGTSTAALDIDTLAKRQYWRDDVPRNESGVERVHRELAFAHRVARDLLAKVATLGTEHRWLGFRDDSTANQTIEILAELHAGTFELWHLLNRYGYALACWSPEPRELPIVSEGRIPVSKGWNTGTSMLYAFKSYCHDLLWAAVRAVGATARPEHKLPQQEAGIADRASFLRLVAIDLAAVRKRLGDDAPVLDQRRIAHALAFEHHHADLLVHCRPNLLNPPAPDLRHFQLNEVALLSGLKADTIEKRVKRKKMRQYGFGFPMEYSKVGQLLNGFDPAAAQRFFSRACSGWLGERQRTRRK